MKLVLFTAHYPFGQGESFLEEVTVELSLYEAKSFSD